MVAVGGSEAGHLIVRAMRKSVGERFKNLLVFHKIWSDWKKIIGCFAF